MITLTEEKLNDLLDEIQLSQSDTKDFWQMTFNGKPIGEIILVPELEIYRWWPALKEEISRHLCEKLGIERKEV